jgi:hypothetical protein
MRIAWWGIGIGIVPDVGSHGPVSYDHDIEGLMILDVFRRRRPALGTIREVNHVIATMALEWPVLRRDGGIVTLVVQSLHRHDRGPAQESLHSPGPHRMSAQVLGEQMDEETVQSVASVKMAAPVDKTDLPDVAAQRTGPWIGGAVAWHGCTAAERWPAATGRRAVTS